MSSLRRPILLIPGPLTTSNVVKLNTFRDYSAREPLFIEKIKFVRDKLLEISNLNKNKYTSVLFQGSGTYANESVISCLPNNSKVDVFSNGIYGIRLADICSKYNNLGNVVSLDKKQQITGEIVENALKNSKSSHIAFVHNETTTGIENCLEDICEVAKKYDKKIILDAISSFGGIPINIDKLNIDYLTGSSNKCLHGYPGIGFVIANKESLEECKDNSKTLSLDIYEQYKDFDEKEQFRFTPPVQVISALQIGIDKLIYDGGIDERYKKYKDNNKIVRNELTSIGFRDYVDKSICSPVVSTYHIPSYIENFDFNNFSQELRKKNIVLYPSPINEPDIIRVGNIGDITSNELYESMDVIKSLINN